jgi:hypothetical protein
MDAPPALPSKAAAPKPGHKRRDSRPPPPVKQKKAPVWAHARDPDTGDVYFYHQETGEVTWDQPPDYDGEPVA